LVTDRRGFTFGVALAAMICAISFALNPSLWFDYVGFLTEGVQVLDSGWFNLGATIPLTLRLGLAGLFAALAIRFGRLAAVACTLALPVLWFHGLSVLVAAAATPKRRGTPDSA
jgi:hypothetical protein